MDQQDILITPASILCGIIALFWLDDGFNFATITDCLVLD